MEDFRLLVHLVSVAVWVGGQITLAGVVHALRPAHSDALPVVARAFARVAWPAYAVAVVSGAWMLWDVDVARSGTDYQRTLALKLVLVAASGAGAAWHAVTPSRFARAVGAALGLVCAVGAMVAAVAL